MLRIHRRLGIAALALVAALALPAIAAGPPVRAQSAPQPPANAVEVTAADSGQTIYIGVGQPLMVRLNPNNTWSVAVDDDTLLQATTPVDGLPDGVQAEFTAVAIGITPLRATGTAHCAPGVPCPQYALQFTATIYVVPADTTVIGPDANGGTITIAQGDMVYVQLGAGFNWTLQMTPGDVLFQAEPDVDLGPGVQEALLAEGTGSVDVEGTGTPNCPPNQACPAIAAVFSTTIVVQ